MERRKLVPTVCPYCGVGCGFYLVVEGNRVTNIEYMTEHPLNQGALCPKGNAALQMIYHKDRLRHPMKRENGTWKRIEWPEALETIASKLSQIKDSYGPNALAFISSSRCTNEENYLMQKLARMIGTNNVDNCARVCHSPSVAGLSASFGSGAMTNPLEDLVNSSCIFCIGTNFAEAHPIVSRWVLYAKDKGAKVIVVDPRYTPTAWLADIFLQIKPGTDIAFINAMIYTILEEGLANRQFIEKRTTGLQGLEETIKNYPPEEMEKITAIPADKIREVARIYAKSPASAIIYCLGITEHITGTDNVIDLANLSLICGQVGKKGGGVNPLRGQNNVQGACDMGALPALLPGYVKLDNEVGRQKLAHLWGLEDLPKEPGLSLIEMTEAAVEGELHGMYIMGENPAVSDPDSQKVREGLKNLDFLVVQDIFLTETAEFAHIVLPAACWAEKEGTVTGTERRVQWMQKGIEPPGEAKPDWLILCQVATSLGLAKSFEYRSPSDVLEEINQAVPIYAGITPKRVQETLGGLLWPCPDVLHPGTPILHLNLFNTPDGRARIIPVEYQPPFEPTSEEYPFILTTGRAIIHYNTASMTRRSPSLDKRSPEAYVEIHPEDARKLGITQGDSIQVATKRAQVTVRAEITRKVAPGVVFMALHYPETNFLTLDQLDPKSKCPEYKVAACKIKKV